MEKLRQGLEKLIREVYAGESKVLVHGEGSINAKVMLIGEAPGEQETLKRRPFVGKAGKNLDEFLSLAHLSREEIFVSNVVKIRPTEIGPTGRKRNRAPNKEELALFIPWLMKKIGTLLVYVCGKLKMLFNYIRRECYKL